MTLLAAFLWGAGNVASKTVLTDLDPFAAVAARNLVGLLVLLPFAMQQFFAVGNRRVWLKSAMLPSLLFTAAILSQQWGFQSTSVTNASFLVSACSVLTPVMAYVFLRDRIGPIIGLAAALTLFGAFLMSGAHQSWARMNAGDIGCLVAAVFYAGWIVALSRHAVRHGQALATTCLHCAVTTATAFCILIVLSPKQPGIWTNGLPEVLYLGVFSTAVAFALMAWAQERLSASTAAVLSAAESLFGAGGGFLMLGERLGTSQALGATLILTAILMAGFAVPSPARRSLEPKASGADPAPGDGQVAALGLGRLDLYTADPPRPHDPDCAGCHTADTDYQAAKPRRTQQRSGL